MYVTSRSLAGSQNRKSALTSVQRTSRSKNTTSGCFFICGLKGLWSIQEYGGGKSTFLIEKKGIRQTTARLGKQRCDRLWDGEEKKQTQSGTSSTHVHRYLDYSWTVSGLIIASGQEFSTSVKKGYSYKTTLSRG